MSNIDLYAAQLRAAIPPHALPIVGNLAHVIAEALLPTDAPVVTPPIAAISHVATGLSVAFADTSTGTVTARLWDFGDGATSTEQHPTHVYAAAGEYTVRLIVTNGATMTLAQLMLTVFSTNGGGGEGFNLLTPANGATLPYGNAMFTWQAHAEAESYTLRVYDSAEATEPETEITGITDPEQILTPIEGARWWDVLAITAGDPVVSNQRRSFEFAAAPPAPGVFNLSLPADASSGAAPTLFQWDTSTNTDAYTLEIYRLPKAPFPPPSPVISKTDLPTPEYVPDPLDLSMLTAGEYEWSVVARNAGPTDTDASNNPFTFTVE